MFTLSTLIVTTFVALLVGGALGAIVIKSVHPGEKQSRELEGRVKQAEEKLKDYQQDVSEHFAETSKLVNQLTQSYKEVHQHLADSALKLSNPDLSRQLIDAGNGKLLTHDDEPEASDITQPPRDWAPRTPDSKGQLSEDYGLEPHPHQPTPKPQT